MGWVSASGTAALEATQMTDKAGQPYDAYSITVDINRLEALNYDPSVMADVNDEGWITQVAVREAEGWRLAPLEEYDCEPPPTPSGSGSAALAPLRR